MSTVWLDRDDCLNGTLPPVCVRCGAGATTTVRRTFHLDPMFLGPLAVVFAPAGELVAHALGRSMTLRVPVCGRHRRHWLSRALTAYALLVSGLLGFGAAVVVGADGARPPDAVLHLIGGGALWLVLMLAAASTVHLTAVRATAITDDGIRLTGVSERFAEAVRSRQRYDD